MVAMRVWVASAAGIIAASSTGGGRADEMPSPGEAWKTSPFHGAINGATGQPIPCVCRFKGAEFKLGAAVCMNTHVGTVIARCDLLYNNTTWVPTTEPCTISLIPARPRTTAVLHRSTGRHANPE